MDKSGRSGGVIGGKRSVKPRVVRMSMDRMSTVSRFEVVKFDGSGNFGLWQLRVKDLLMQQGNLAGLAKKKPEKMEADVWEEKQTLAVATIRLCLSDQVMHHMIGLKTPKEIWDKLKTQFMSKTVTTKLYLKQKLYGLKMQEASDLAGHINVFSQMVTDLEQLGVKIETEDKAIILLCSLPSSYEHVVTTLTYGKESIKVEDIIAALLAQELRIKNGAVDGPLGDALLVRGEHSKEKVKEKKKKKVRCYDCGELGHVRRDCPERYQKASANVAMSKSNSDNDGDVLSVSDSVQSTEAWMLDSVSSFHAIHKREWLTSYESGDFVLAYLGDDTGYRAIGVAEIKMRAGVEHVLQGVRHVPGLRRNLISLGALYVDGMLFRAEPDLKTMKIMKGDKTVMIGERTVSHLYKLQGCTIACGVMEDGVAGVAVFSKAAGLR
jgi:hypothetical protein